MLLSKEVKNYFSHPSFIALLMLILCFILYGNCLHNEFLMDDYPMLIYNFHIGEKSFFQLNLETLHNQAYFRPLTHFINFISYTFFGREGYKYHLLNLFLFYLSGLTFYELLNVLFKKPLLSLLTVVLFYAHPINGVLINYKNATAYSLMILAVNLSLLNFVTRKNEGGFPWRAMAWFIIALLCHEVVIVFPLYLILTLIFLQEKSKRILSLCIPVVATAFVYCIFRLIYTATIQDITHRVAATSHSFICYFATVSKLLWWYLEKLVTLKDIVLIWDTPIVQLGCYIWFSLGVIILAAGLLALKYYRRLKEIAFGVGLMLIGFIPVSLACFSRPWFGIIIEPHWVVYSSMGFFLIVAACFLKMMRGLVNKNIVATAFLCLLVFYAFETNKYNRLWSTQEGYCKFWRQVSPHNYMPTFWLAFDYFEKRNFKEAKMLFMGLLNSGLGTSEVYGNLGKIEYCQGNYDKALVYFNKSLKKDPNVAVTYYYLGCVYMNLGQNHRAKMSFLKALQLDNDLIDTKRKLDIINKSK